MILYPNLDPNAEIVVVTVGGHDFETSLDANGTQRFLPHDRVNPELAEKMKDFDAFIQSSNGRIPSDIYDANNLHMDHYNGVYTEDELLMYHTNSGYSICGLQDLFPDLDFVNPMWDKD